MNICDPSMDDVDMMDKSPAKMLGPADKDAGAFEKICKVIDEKLLMNVLIRNYRKDGTPFWNDLYIREAEHLHR